MPDRSEIESRRQMPFTHRRRRTRKGEAKTENRLAAGWKRTLGYFRRNGMSAALWAVAERLFQEKVQSGYRYVPPAQAELDRQRREAEGWEDAPLFSVLVPAYETPPAFFKALLDCMQAQSWPFWELVIADAGKTDTVRRLAEGRGDDRIRYRKLAQNRGIAANTNEALKEARGIYTGLLDHDDLLTPDALYEMALAIRNREKEGITPVFLYSDEDKCGGTGETFYEPNRKPDFNLDLLFSNNYICHFLLMRTDVFRRLQERDGYDGAQDYDLVLRAAAGVLDGVPEKAYVHVPKILYHWRCHETSTASNPESKRYAYEAGKRALADLCAARGWKAEAEETRHVGFYRLRYQPDILQVRSDVGAAAFPLPSRNGKLRSGIYENRTQGEMLSAWEHAAGGAWKKRTAAEEDAPGSFEAAGKERPLMRYEGLPRHFSGYLHRAVLTQDVEAADVRAMRVRPELEEELQEALQAVRQGMDPVQASRIFCGKIRERGLRICWEPEAGGTQTQGREDGSTKNAGSPGSPRIPGRNTD